MDGEYGEVVIDPKTLMVDEMTTRKLRDTLSKA